MDPSLKQELGGKFIRARQEGRTYSLVPCLDVALDALRMLPWWTKGDDDTWELHLKR